MSVASNYPMTLGSQGRQPPSGQSSVGLNAAAEPFRPTVASNQAEVSSAPKPASPIVAAAAAAGLNLLKRVTLDRTGSDCPAPIVLHLINLSGRAYLSSAEISQLFPRWKKRDLLQQMLDLKKKKLDSVVAAKDTHDELFEQAIW